MITGTIKLPDGNLGLIDISDLKSLNRPLKNGEIKRNFAHMLRYSEDKFKINQNQQAFISGYSSKQNIEVITSFLHNQLNQE